MFTPSASQIVPTLATKPVAVTFLRALAGATGPIPLYLDTAGNWTTTNPGGGAPAHAISPATFALLHTGGTPSPLGEAWTAPAGNAYRLVSMTDAAGDHHGVAVQVGPTDPPPV